MTAKNFRPCIAFKMNYCNGGKDNNHVGFYGICNDAVIKYNIKTKKHAWCSNDDCDCKKYFDKKISRDELNEKWSEEVDGAFTCYESAALRDWCFGAGADEHIGGRKIRGAKAGHLCLLTTVEPNMNECDRFIVAMFIIGGVDETSDGDFVYSKDNFDFCFEFKPTEARKMKFWKVYQNSNASVLWGSGLFRYFSDDDAVKFLKMAVKVTRGTDDEDFAKKFLEYYCKLNGLT